MEIEVGEEYESIEVGSTAKVINLTETHVTYEIIYHPEYNSMFYGRKFTKPIEEFKQKTVRFNSSYEDYKANLNV